MMNFIISNFVERLIWFFFEVNKRFFVISYLFSRIKESLVNSFLGIGCLMNSFAKNSKFETMILKNWICHGFLNILFIFSVHFELNYRILPSQLNQQCSRFWTLWINFYNYTSIINNSIIIIWLNCVQSLLSLSNFWGAVSENSFQNWWVEWSDRFVAFISQSCYCWCKLSSFLILLSLLPLDGLIYSFFLHKYSAL